MDKQYLLTYTQNGVHKYSWFDIQAELVGFAKKLEELGCQINEALYIPTVSEIEW